MSNGEPVASQLDGVDALARDLYRRSRHAGPDFDAATTAVRRLHSILKHVRAEVEDADSILNASERSTLYQRKLTRIIEDCEFTLQSLEAILNKKPEGVPLDDDARTKVNSIASQLADDKTAVDVFLDTVQLPSKPPKVVDAHDSSLNVIKEKVDAIAARLCRPGNDNVPGDSQDDETRWHKFQEELEKEGFSKDILEKNKKVLRAYIRELDTNDNGIGTPPTIQGLLEEEERHQRPDLAVVPISNEYPEAWSPKEMMRPTFDNEKYIPSIKTERRQPEQQPYPPSLQQHSTALSYERHSSDDEGEYQDPNALALISTRDLMAMDGLNSQMGAMQLGVSPQTNYSISPTSSATLKYLPASVSANIPTTGNELALSSSPNNFSTSPRFAPLPPYTQAQTSPPPPYNVSARHPSRLAPDRYGMDIPLDAKWTRIKRSLVSPEVLERAGVRYEARPTYVAVLGILTREEIAHYARLSMEARARRMSQSSAHRPPPSTFERRYNPEYRYGTSNSSRSPEQKSGYSPGPDTKDRKPSQDSDSESVLWDESDTEDDYDEKRSHKGRQFIVVSPPEKEGKNGTSPAATVQPKPILKNKNENHVRFEPEPHEISQDEMKKSPTRSRRGSERDRDRDRDRRRRRRDREREYYESGRDPRDRERERGDRDYHSSSSRRHREYREAGRDYHRDHDRDRDSRDTGERKDKKKWAPTIGAMGIGGAAGSLLSALTEAASGI